MKNMYTPNFLDHHDKVLDHLIKINQKLSPFGVLPITMHWSDSAKLIKLFQSRIKSDEHFQMAINILENKFNALKNEKIWLKKEDIILTMSLYDVYLTLIQHLKNDQFEDQLFNSQDVSFIGPTGPFMNITMIELVRNQFFNDFLYFNILKNKIPQRSFRLHTSGEIIIQFGKDMEQFSKVEVCQLTDNGVLFSCMDDLVLENSSHGLVVKFMIDTSNIYQLLEGKKLNSPNESKLYYTTDELKYFTIDQNKLIKSLSYDSGISGKFYLFARYVHMKDSDLPNVFKQFVEQMKKAVNLAA